jgi:RNA polymerase sigma factor (sigma-70 family)
MSNAAARIVKEDPNAASKEIDPATLRGCRAGDPGAVRAFVRYYERLVFAFLSRSLGSGPHVEDLAQEVFLRAARALPAFDADGPARPSTWLLTIATRVAIDARRRRRLSGEPLAPDVAPVDPATPETERVRAELRSALAAAAAQLPDEQRDAFIMAEFHGLSAAEMAEVLGIPENTAKTRLFRARERLRQLLRNLREES